MSDLISRSSVIKEMEKLKQEVNMPVDIVWNNLLKVCIDTVNEQPTAYDVDKVVKELEDYQMWKGFMIYDLTHREREIIRKAIEIVKGGGVNEQD